MVRRRPSLLALRIVAGVLALMVAGLGRPARAGARPDDATEAEALLAQGDQDRAAGRWAEAAAAFDGAYRQLPEALVPELGPTTVVFAVEAYEQQATQADDDAPLRAALDLLDLYEADHARLVGADPIPGPIQDARARIEAALPEPGADSGPPPAPVVPSPATTPAPPRDVLAWSLVGVGGAAVVAGIATLTWGSRMLPIARDRLDERGPDLLDPDADDEYLRVNRRRGRIVMAVGGGLALAGAAAVVVGVVRLTGGKDKARGRVDMGPGGVLVRF